MKNSLNDYSTLCHVRRAATPGALLRAALLLLTYFTTSVWQSPAQTYTPNPQEFVGPFPNWVNVKTRYGAKGDGVTDDSQALQRAFSELGTSSVNGSTVLYLPAGTYRITTGLTMSAKLYISVIGEDPATTRIKWDGTTGGTMFLINGVAYSQFSRITWDGARRAKTAIAHKWDNQTGYAVTHNEHSDEAFIDVEHGLRAGTGGSMDAETAVLRCRFIRNTIAGISIESWNALDWYVWDSYFEDCRVGVTNNPPTGGAGNFHVYHSIFKRSTYADINMLQTMYFSVRDNYSIGSKAFFIGEFVWQNGGPITLQKNTIIDPLSATPIYFGSKGPITLLDNVIRSSDGHTGPVVSSEGDITTVGNVFTISNTVSGREKKISIDDVVQSRTTINAAEPALLAMPRKKSRRVFELLPGNVDDRFQKTIDSAAALSGQRPVIHLRSGTYTLSKTAVVPAGADIQLIGDGFGAAFKWAGAQGGELIRLEGADKMVLQGFTINGNADWSRGIGLTIKHSDQADRQVFMEGVTVTYNDQAGVLMEGFKHTTAELHDFNHSVTNTVGVKVVGTGSTNTLTGGLSIFGGSSSANTYSYDVANGGNLLAQDIWYEGQPKGFVNLTGSGNFTMNGARIYANAAPDTPIMLDNFNGRATFLGVHMNGKFTVKGDGANTNALAMGNQFDTQNAYSNVSPNAKASMLNSRVYNAGSYPLANTGSADAAFLRRMLEQVRTVRPRYKSGATGLVMHRVKVTQSVIGIRMQAGTIASLPQNQAPAVSLTSPTNNTTVAAPASVAIAANASDGDGQVAKVEFYHGSTKLGEDIDGSNGWSHTWTNVAAGNYTITAKAIDNAGAAATSGAVALSVASAPVANQPPTVNAGYDRTITLPLSSITLTGTANDADGSIAGYAWTKQSGPAATLSGANTASLSASGLTAGTYLFRLTVTDDKGAAKFDEVTVTVNAAVTTEPQKVVSLVLINADTDRDIATLTEGYVINLATIGTRNLSVRANTNPATVGSVAFQLNGRTTQTESFAPYSIAGDNNGNYNAWKPGIGSYGLTATPFTSSGGAGTKGLALTVNFTVIDNAPTAPAPANQLPAVHAGTDRAIALPVNSVTLTGTASDPDGSITGYNWSKQSGPAAGLSGAATATLSVTGLTAGTYVFRLTVTDSQGATAFDELTLTVNSAPVTDGQQVVSFTLVNADTDQDIGPLSEGDVVNIAAIGTRSLSIRANTNPATVGSVVFGVSGTQSHSQMEAVAPYAVAGDNSGNYIPWTPAIGSYSVKATPYTGTNGTGTRGTALTVNFTIINNSTVAAAVSTTSTASGARVAQPVLQDVEVYPNPATSSTTLAFTTGQTEEMDIVVTNSLVLEVKRIRFKAQAGLNTVVIPIHDLRTGTYTINVGNKFVDKLIVGQ